MCVCVSSYRAISYGYPWHSLATLRYCSSLPAGPQGYTPYPHRDAVCKFNLVALFLLDHVKGSIGVHHLWTLYIYIYIYIYIYWTKVQRCNELNKTPIYKTITKSFPVRKNSISLERKYFKIESEDSLMKCISFRLP